MWLLFHRNKKTRAVADGERFVETCPSCKVRATFVEVEMEENVGLFFVDIVGDKQRAFRCSSCAETFERKDDDAVEEKSPQQLERERREAEQKRLAAAKLAEKQRLLEEEKRREAVAEKAVRIEDELAALKARLGKR